MDLGKLTSFFKTENFLCLIMEFPLGGSKDLNNKEDAG